MKRMCAIAGLLASLCGAPVALAGPFDDFNIYFVNGINNSRDEAENSQRMLKQLVLPDAPSANIDKLYNTSEGVLADLLEAYRLAGVDKEFTNFWQWLDKPNMAPEWFQAIYYPTLAKYNESLYTQDPDLQLMLFKLRAKAQLRKKTILVAHSEGNFYANIIANNLRSSPDPSLADCVGIVAVATPATYVSGGGPYTTLANDFVINRARARFPWGANILPPSPPTPVYSGKHGGLGHGFVASYLVPLTPRIRAHVVSVADQINTTCKPSCADSNMAIWVANDNNVTDDNFRLNIDNSYLADLILGNNNCNGHMIMPTTYSSFKINNVSFHPDVTGRIGGCLPTWRADTSSRLLFSANVPATRANSAYSVNLINIKNNQFNNYGRIYSFQVCPHPSDGHPVLRRLLTSAVYSGNSGSNIGPFNFSTSQCLPCDDLDNNGSFPNTQVTVPTEVTGAGICTAAVNLSGPTPLSWQISSSVNGYKSSIKLNPGAYNLTVSSPNISCRIGTTFASVAIALTINSTTIVSADVFFKPSVTFTIPAVPTNQ